MAALDIRPELPDDRFAIHDINTRAFGRPDEADLVDALRANDGALLSLVAVVDQHIVGHILFSPVQLGPLTGAGLAPMAVRPGDQGRGIGSALVRAGMEQIAHARMPFIVVLGHPEYYPRFGFTPARPLSIACQWDVPDEAFMVRILDPETMRHATGEVRYRPEFSAVT